MAITMLGTGIYFDSDLEDGYVRVETPAGARLPDVYLTSDTYFALCRADVLDRFFDAVDILGDGVHLLPRSVIEADAAADLRAAIALGEVGDACVMPGCLQDVVDASRGFSVCAGHGALLRDWDDLLQV